MESAQRFHMKSRVRFKFPTLWMGIKFPNPWKTLIIKFPPPQDSKGVKCSGYAQGGGGGVLKLWFDQYIYVHALLIQYSCRNNWDSYFLKKDYFKENLGMFQVHLKIKFHPFCFQKAFTELKFVTFGFWRRNKWWSNGPSKNCKAMQK